MDKLQAEIIREERTHVRVQHETCIQKEINIKSLNEETMWNRIRWSDGSRKEIIIPSFFITP
jgi:hypothetical protein